MSVQTELDRIISAVGAAYDAVELKGGTVPQSETVAGLAAAVQSIPTGGAAKPEQEKTVTITANGTTEITPDSGKTLSKVTAVVNVQQSGGGTANPHGITFYDYDGAVITSWTLSELASKTALPDYPTHVGLTCQGWNWTLEDLKNENIAMNVGATYITNDGKTRIYIHLDEGRTSPMLGCLVNGTVTVDWGDGTNPDVLTGTSDLSDLQHTPNHNYASPGDYIITLTVSGTARITGYAGSNITALLGFNFSTSDSSNLMYASKIKKVEIGSNMQLDNRAFASCPSLSSITIPSSITNLGMYTFYLCGSLKYVVIPYNGGGNVGGFETCYTLESVSFPKNIFFVAAETFSYCMALRNIIIPKNTQMIDQGSFQGCSNLSSITLPKGTAIIDQYAFAECAGLAIIDLTGVTSIPTLQSDNAFGGVPSDFQIRVPASLVDNWKAATNWATYADHIVGV